jgi:hypothetical protein
MRRCLVPSVVAMLGCKPMLVVDDLSSPHNVAGMPDLEPRDRRPT